MLKRKTKIVCTIGPASEEIAVIKELLINGLNIARLNLSHGTHEEHSMRIANIREASKQAEIPVAIMLDTKGPEIRIGLIEGGKAVLVEGEEIVLTTQEVLGSDKRIMVNYQGLPKDVREGTQILMDDGLISLRVKKVEGEEITCRIENGGEISDRKKINIPEEDINLPSLSQKDMEDLALGVKEKVDFIAASFIRSATDVLAIRKVIEDLGASIDIISKIENRQGVNNIDEIIEVSDGIMVARGDLGVEIPAEEVPIVQKMLIEKCNIAGKPVITATQMLDSMIRNPRPTRAEASDVANAIYDGSGAIMLSGETATGKYPIEAVKTMDRIAKRIEESLNWEEMRKKRAHAVVHNTTEAISYATCTTAASLGASAIITSTKSGSTARMVSKYRPQNPIIAVTPLEEVVRKLLLIWGVYPFISPEHSTTDGMIEGAIETALKNEIINNGDLVVLTAGVPVGIPGSTNLIKVHTIGEVLAKGTGIGRESVKGKVVAVNTAEEAISKIKDGDILVVPATDRDYIPAIEKAGALITEEGGLTSHGAIVGINLSKPVIVGVENAVAKLRDISLVTLDTKRGLIYRGNANVK